jgi:hypothetical protein
MDFYKHPDFVKELFARISKVYIEFSEIQKKIVGEPNNQGIHGNPNVRMEKGGMRLCEDVAVMLSPKIYRSFCRPFNDMCLKPFEGGMVHFCCSSAVDGRHILNEVISSPYVKAFAFGSPGKFYNFKETVEHFQKKHVCLVWTDGSLQGQTVENWVETIANSLQEKTGIIFSISVESFKKAQMLMNCWLKQFQ